MAIARNIILLGQALSAQATVLVDAPRFCAVQVKPPNAGDGHSQVLSWFLIPVPQVTEHAELSLYSQYPPFTKKKVAFGSLHVKNILKK